MKIIAFFYLFSCAVAHASMIKMICPGVDKNQKNCVKIVHVLNEEGVQQKKAEGCMRQGETVEEKPSQAQSESIKKIPKLKNGTNK